MRVLVALEDDESMQSLIAVNLSFDARLEVRGVATNARDAIELARAMQPDLIIVDHFIDGDVMGLDAAPDLKAAAPRARLLLFTSHDLRIEAERSPAIDGYLSKTQINELLVTVQRMLDLEPLVGSGSRN